MNLLLTLVVCLTAAALFGELFAFFRVPRVIGQIVAGLLLGLGPVRSLVFDSAGLSVVDALANIGVILLLFFTGLEINFRLFVKNLVPSSGISFFNTVLPLSLGFVVCQLFGLSVPVSLLVGVCISVSATALALDLLEEMKLLKTRIGSLIVAAGAVDDVYELVLITSALAVIETISAQAAVFSLVVNVVIFSGVIFLFRLVVVPLVLRFAHVGGHANVLTSGLIITLLMAGLSEFLGFGVLLGALISGILVRHVLHADASHHRPWESHQISNYIHLITFGFFAPFFFLRIGILTDVGLIFQNVWFSLVITSVAIFGTVFGSAFGHYVVSKNWKDAFLIGWAMNAKGDTELVIANLALASGLITPAIFSSLIFMAVVSTLISPVVFRFLAEKNHP